MKVLLIRLSDLLVRRPWLIALLAVLVVPAAFLINLGIMPFDSDEPTRALVALEMVFSGNYITPTINGDYYYNKPPFYNWIIISSWTLWGEMSEFATRFPTVISLFGYTLTIYLFSRLHFPRRWALLNALLFLTCGRILFYDSFLGLIDICFSWVIFTLFMVVYHYHRLKRYAVLFPLAYGLCAIAFLMKGLPSIVFLGTVLLVVFIWKRDFRKLFSWQHVLGGLVFLAVLALYYGFYLEYNSLETAFKTLFTETSKRTVVRFGIWQTILHIFTFPLEMVYHFLPWSLLILLLVRRSFWRLFRQHDFVQFCGYTFFFAVIPYWTSPEVFPRYLLMLAPLIFTVFLYFLIKAESERARTTQVLFVAFAVIAVGLAIGIWATPWVPPLEVVSHLPVKVLILFVLLALALLVMLSQQSIRFIAFAAVLLVARLGFSWFVLPARHAEAPEVQLRAQDVYIGKTYADEPMELASREVVGHFASFYIARERGQVLPRTNDTIPVPGKIYIMAPFEMTNPEVVVRDSLTIVWEKRKRYLVQYREREE